MPPLKPRCQVQQRRMHPVCTRLTLIPLCTARTAPMARRRVTSGATAHTRTTTTAPTAVMAGQALMGMGQMLI